MLVNCQGGWQSSTPACCLPHPAQPARRGANAPCGKHQPPESAAPRGGCVNCCPPEPRGRLVPALRPLSASQRGSGSKAPGQPAPGPYRAPERSPRRLQELLRAAVSQTPPATQSCAQPAGTRQGQAGRKGPRSPLPAQLPGSLSGHPSSHSRRAPAPCPDPLSSAGREKLPRTHGPGGAGGGRGGASWRGVRQRQPAKGHGHAKGRRWLPRVYGRVEAGTGRYRAPQEAARTRSARARLAGGSGAWGCVAGGQNRGCRRPHPS